MNLVHAVLGATCCLMCLQACQSTPLSPAATTAGAAGDETSLPLGGIGNASSGGGTSGAGAGGASDDPTAGAAGAAGAPELGCSAEAVAGIDVFSAGWDPLGYPPYAIDGCTLVYIAPAAGGGALHRRDLATGVDTLLEVAAKHPRRPALAGSVIAWERDGEADGSSGVSVQLTEPETRTRLFEQAGEPRAAGDAVVFTKFLGAGPGGDTDVFLYDVASDTTSPIASGPGQQRFADVSTTHVALTDFSEDPQGAFNESGSISDVIIVDRKSGQATPRKAPGKQAFPLLGSDGLVVYLEWGAVHPEPKFGEFWLKAGNIAAPVTADFNVKQDGPVSTNPAYVRPSLHGVHVDFIDMPGQTAQLFRSTLGASSKPVAVTIENAATLLGPASADWLTLVAKPLVGQNLELIAVAR